MAEIQFDTDSFAERVTRGEGVVMVDFWAPWCGPCVVMGPVIEEIAKDFAGKAVVGKVNVDDYGQLAEPFGVQSIPTIIIFKAGHEVDRVIGSTDKAVLVGKLEKALA